MKKKPFILLEILIAISIVSLLASYLIYRPFRELKKELSTIISLEEARVWEGKLLEIEYALRRDCDSLPLKKKYAEKREVLFTVSLPGIQKKCKRRYKAWAESKKDDKNTPHYLIHMVMQRGKSFFFKPDYKFYEKIMSPASSPTEELMPG